MSSFALFLVLFCLSLVGFYLFFNKSATTDWGNPVLNCLDGLNHYFCRHYHRLAHTEIPLPETGSAILVSNHVSGLDPLILIAATRRPLRFMIAQEEYDRWWLNWLFRFMQCIPVKRDKNPKKAFRESLAALTQGEVLVIFPQGEIVSGDIIKPLKKGVFILSQLSSIAITSVRIDGVKAKGLTVAAVFIRSNISLIIGDTIDMITRDTLKTIMQAMNVFFLTKQ